MHAFHGCGAQMDAEALFNRRLWVRAGVVTSVAAAVVVCFISGPKSSSALARAAAVLVPQPFFAVLMACVSPGASKADLSSPVLKRGMLYASALQAATATCSWMSFAMAGHLNPCGPISLVPGLCMRLTFNAVPILGMINARWYQNTGVTYWPSYRFALISTGILQLARVAARTHAVRLAEAMAALGFSGLLPVAAACQAHRWFLPGQVSLATAIGFGFVSLFLGLVMTPAVRTRLAVLSGSFGLPAARVFHLNDGVLLQPDTVGGEMTDPAAGDRSNACSSGLAGKKTSLWSGWSAGWSDYSDTPTARLVRSLGPAGSRLGDALPRNFKTMQSAIKAAKARFAEDEARKAIRRAEHHGKAYGKLVWLLLRRAQRRCPGGLLSTIPRDALRIIVNATIVDETARLEQLYSARLKTGAPSYRG